MKGLPRRLGPRAGLFDIIDYLADMAEYLGDFAVDSRHKDILIMATQADLQAEIDRLTASTDAASVAITTEMTQLADAIAALAAAAPVDLQPQVDQVRAASDRLEAAVSALNSDDAPVTP